MKKSKKTSSKDLAVYAGTFDPITNGHLDVLFRALRVFDKVYIAISKGGPKVSAKSSYFTIKERLSMAQGAVRELNIDRERVVVEPFEGMLVNYLESIGSKFIIRGLRAVADYEYETQLAHTNRLLNPEIETIFFVPSESNSFISSSIVRNVALNGGDISKMVPKIVKTCFNKK